MTAYDSARAMLRLGLPVIALYGVRPDGTCRCWRGERGCQEAGKQPKDKDWTADPIRTEQALADREANDGPGRNNYGLATGHPVADGRMVLVWDVDTDGVKPGAATMRSLPPMPPTFVVRTGGGGLHFYLLAPHGVVFGNQGGTLPGIDVRAVGGQVLLPGSVSSKGSYAVLVPGPMFAEAPTFVLDAIAARKPDVPRGETGTDAPAMRPPGSRAEIERAVRIGRLDRSVDTARIVAACAQNGLTLGQTRRVVDSRADLRARLDDRSDDDVGALWAKEAAKEAARRG